MAHVSPVPARQSASVNTRATKEFALALSYRQTQAQVQDVREACPGGAARASVPRTPELGAPLSSSGMSPVRRGIGQSRARGAGQGAGWGLVEREHGGRCRERGADAQHARCGAQYTALQGGVTWGHEAQDALYVPPSQRRHACHHPHAFVTLQIQDVGAQQAPWCGWPWAAFCAA